MIDLNLTPSHMAAYRAALVDSHRIRITIMILDRNEKPLRHLQAPKIVSGSVQVDASADVTRSLELVCLDPAHKLDFDHTSPAKGAVYADNFVSVKYGVFVASHNFWVDVPVFWGPLTKFTRQGPEVTLEAQGKETLGLDPHLVTHGYTIAKGTHVRDAIRNVMGRLGEARFNLGMVRGRLRTHRSVVPGEAPWAVCVGGSSNGGSTPGLLSKSSGHVHLFYDGEGRLTAKRLNTSSVFVFTGGHVVSHPGFAYDILEARNHVEVTGGTPKKSKRHFRGSATLSASHPLSPHALSRNSKPRYLVTFFESDSLKSDAACRAKAKSILAANTTQALDATFECLPVPHLEEHDAVTLKMDGYNVAFTMKTFTIPLTADASMSVGFAKSVRPR